MKVHLTTKIKKLISFLNCLIIFQRRKIKAPILFDIGAREGVLQPWRLLAEFGCIKVYGFEPDSAEIENLNRQNKFQNNLPFALGDEERKSNFYITSSPACSSLLIPNVDLIRKYPNAHHFQVKRIETVQTKRLEKVVKDKSLPHPEFLKIDVQGYEYNVLKGAGELLTSSVLCIELEAHLKQLYCEQKTLFEIIKYLEGFNFVLCDFRKQGNFGDEIVEANCFFIKKDNALSQDQQEKIRFWKIANNMQK